MLEKLFVFAVLFLQDPRVKAGLALFVSAIAALLGHEITEATAGYIAGAVVIFFAGIASRHRGLQEPGPPLKLESLKEDAPRG